MVSFTPYIKILSVYPNCIVRNCDTDDPTTFDTDKSLCTSTCY